MKNPSRPNTSQKKKKKKSQSTHKRPTQKVALENWGIQYCLFRELSMERS